MGRSIGVDVRAPLAEAGKKDWLLRLTQVGFAAKGIVYILVGTLALLAAFHRGGETTDQRGAIATIAEQPFGEFALIVIAAGLFAYAAWRLICAVANTEAEPASAKGAGKRAGYALSGLAHAGLAWFAIQTLRGNASNGDQAQTWTARLMQAPAGSWLVMLVGLIVIVVGVYQVRHGLREKFAAKLKTGRMSRQELRWALRAGKWGYAARGLVFGIIGVFLAYAGLHSNAAEAKGLEGALDTVAAQPFGQFLLALVALGLALYGVYSLVEARYRRLGV